MEDILNNLNFDWRIWLVNFAGFGLLLLAAKNMVFVPIGKVIEERQSDIQKTYDQLDADQRQMQALRTEYEARLAAVEAEGRERITNMIKEAQATRDSVLSDANGRAHELISRAESEVAREKEQAMITLRKQVADLAIGAAERVIGDNLDQTRSRKLVDDFITTGGTAAPDYSAPLTVSVSSTASVAASVPSPAPVVEVPKPSNGATAFVAGAVAAGVAAVAAVANAMKNAADDAREAAADVAGNVEDSLRSVPETVVAGTEASPEIVDAPAKKPRVVRKKSDTPEETGA